MEDKYSPLTDERSLDQDETFLQKLETLTRALTPLEDMAILLGVSESFLSDLLNDRTTHASQIYRRIRAELRLQLRQYTVQRAAKGSAEAEEKIVEYMENSEL